MAVKRVIACYKAYRGGEWFGASLESIAPFVQGIVVAIAAKPWDAALSRPENCSGPLGLFCARHPDMPVAIEMVDYRNHEEHQVRCLEMVAEHFGPESTVLTPDTDEVWSDADLRTLLEYVKKNPGRVYMTAIWDYVRSPYWRIGNAAGNSFIAALSSPVPTYPFRTVHRAMGRREDRVSVPGIRFHHFCFVRDDEREIPEKMHLCELQDGAYRSDWMNTIWTQLPMGTNLHPALGCGHVWPKVDVIKRRDLPPVLETVESSRRILDKYATPYGRP